MGPLWDCVHISISNACFTQLFKFSLSQIKGRVLFPSTLFSPTRLHILLRMYTFKVILLCRNPSILLESEEAAYGPTVQ